jgi:pimeloyl-ACP methyl ester carboxylesterase
MHRAGPILFVAAFIFAECVHARSAVAPPAAFRPTERTARVFGEHIHYLEAGAGPTIILIHGLGDDAGVWQAEMAPLAREHHVIAVDQIGFGRSDKPLLNYRAETLVDFLDEFLRSLRLAHVTLVGNSLGGWVAALFAIHHPERVQKLVLIDSAGVSGLAQSLGPRLLRALRLASIEDLALLGPLTFSDPRYYQPGDVLRTAFAARVAAGDSYTVDRIMDSIERGDDTVDGHLREIAVPTLIVWGRQDGLIPLRFGKYLQKEIPGARLVTIDHCGHEPQVECPQPLEAAVEGFLLRGR